MRKVIVIVALLAPLLIFSAAAAHDIVLLRSYPANGAILVESPAQVRAWFGEELQTGDSALQVFSAAGQRVDSRDGSVDLTDPDHASMVVSLPALPDGEYLVRWYAVLLDGDASEGSFSFFVGDEAAASAAGYAPADEVILSYQAEGEEDSIPWILIGSIAVGLVAVLLPLIIRLRRKMQINPK